MTARTTGALRRLAIVAIALGAAAVAPGDTGVALGPVAARPAVAQTVGATEQAAAQEVGAEWAIAVHGGAGTARRESMTPELESRYAAALTAALEAGGEILASGGSSLDAVEAALRLLEDSPLFNAGKGAVFTHDGRNELDASIMDGASLAAGAVAAVHHVKNPISLARRVMEASPHVMMAGVGAEEFALEQGIELVPATYFFTESRWQSLQRAREAERRADAEPVGALGERLGTVGAVALDRHGNLAAGTTTGGMTNKRFGRIGDSPIIGAGTYADNRACAVSGTGHGEFFMRNAVAHDICARVLYLEESIGEAADAVVMGVLVEQGGDGGVIAMDPEGVIAMPFTTPSMLRGYVTSEEGPVVEIFRE
ncbi:MAG: isoaspartyl peptidase/L-asparaginase [Gemmatimonadota bacterium]